MTVFDYGVIAILVASLALGLWRGLIGEVLALLAWVRRLWRHGSSGRRSAPADGDCRSGLRVLAGYAAVFVAVLVVLGLLRAPIRGLLKALGLTAVDRRSGVFGRRGHADRADWWRSGYDPRRRRNAGGVKRTVGTAGNGRWRRGPGCRRKRRNGFISGSNLVGNHEDVRNYRRCSSTPVNQLLYDGLMVLQHRGQDAAGIATAEGNTFHMHKGPGLVRDVFRTRNMRALPGNMGIGHAATRRPARPTTSPRRSPSTSIRLSASCSATTAT